MKTVEFKKQPGTITIGDILDTLKEKEKNSDLKISAEMQKSIDSLNTMNEQLVSALRFPSYVLTFDIPIAGQFSKEHEEIMAEIRKESEEKREEAARDAGVPERDCISLDSHIFLCDLPGKTGIYLYKEGKFHFKKFKPMLIKMIAHLFQIRTYPYPRNSRNVQVLAEKFSNSKSKKDRARTAL